MSDELDIKLKTILEADESKSAAQIEKQLPSIAGKIKGKIKVQVEADADSAKSIQASVKAATSSVKDGSVVVPIKVKTDDKYLKEGLNRDFRKFRAQARDLLNEPLLNTSIFEKAFNTGDFKTARSELTLLYKTLHAISAEDISKMPALSIQNFSKNVKTASSTIETLQSRLNKLTVSVPGDVTGKIETLRSELNSLSQIEPGKATGIDVERFNKVKIGIQDVVTSLTKLRALDSDFKFGKGLEKLDTDILRAKQNLENMRVLWSKAFKKPEFLQEWQRLFDIISGGSIKSRAELSAVNAQISLMSKQIEGAGLNVKTIFGRLWDNIKKFTTWLGAGNLIMTAVRGVKDMVTAVKDVDQAMTSLRKVTDNTDTAYKNFLSDASQKATQLGTTITSLIDSTSTFARLGYTLKDAYSLGEIATVYANVGDGIASVEDASNSIISTMAGFKMGVSDAASIVDKFNNVGNKFAITSGGIGEALRRSASALAESNINLDEAIGLITSANTVVQDVESVGTGLKTLSLRIRSSTSDLEDMGEEVDEYAKSTSKLQGSLKALTGVDIMKNANEYKSVFTILEEIAKVYDDLTDVSQANVLEILFGKRQANIGAAILGNFDIAANAMQASMDSAGSAQKEYQKWLTSVEAKQKRAEAAFQGFSNAIMSSELIKGYYDTSKGILGFLTTLTEQLGALPVLASAAAAALSFKNVGWPKMSGYRVSLPIFK